MEKYFRKVLFLIIASLLLGCSNEEEAETNEQNRSVIYRSQLVTIILQDVELNQNEYLGNLDGMNIKFMKVDDDKVMFLVPQTTDLGNHQITIPNLNNLTINYEIRETLLNESPESTIAPFKSNLIAFSQTLDTSIEAIQVQNSIDNFNEVYDNASLEDKTQISVLYMANKALFDDILLNDFSNITGRNVEPSDVVLLAKHSWAVYLMAVGAIVTIAAPNGVDQILGITLVAAGGWKAREYFIQISNKKWKTVQCLVGNVLGINTRNAANDFLTFESEVSSDFNFDSLDRGFIISDTNSVETAVISFFEDYDKYNYYINKINTVILWVNSNIPFADFSTIFLEELPESSPEVNENVTQNSFNNFTFSINHPNLQLISYSFESIGQLNMQINITETPSSLPIETFLYFSYHDQFSSFSGKLPIKVTYDCTNSTLMSNVTVDGFDAWAEVTGGVPPYAYAWSNGATSPTLSNLTVGNYSLDITDALGCVSTSTFSVGCADIPIINNALWICNTYDKITARVSFSAPISGINISGGGSAYCEPEELSCYPVRLYFKSSPSSEWSIAYNGYDVNWVSGDIYGGVLELSLTSSWAYCDGQNPQAALNASYPNYQWKVELMNPCNERVEMAL